MGDIIEVLITNLPMKTATITYEDGREELTGGTLSLFGEQLQLIPRPEKKIQTIVRNDSKRALKTVSATAKINTDLLTDLSNQSGKKIEFAELVADLCTLLSFGSRRGVSFVPSKEWWPWSGKPIVRGECRSCGPVLVPEIGSLIERGLPKVYDPFYTDNLRVVTALRWFTAWHKAQFVEGKFITLWIVIEMLAKNYWKQQPLSSTPKPKKDIDKVFQYLDHFQLPRVSLVGPDSNHPVTVSDVPLTDMYQARNTIVHGDPEGAEKEMCNWFGLFVDKRVRELGAVPGTPGYPAPNEYGACLNEAITMLSRVLEKVFLNLFDCKDFLFYNISPVHSAMSP